MCVVSIYKCSPIFQMICKYVKKCGNKAWQLGLTQGTALTTLPLYFTSKPACTSGGTLRAKGLPPGCGAAEGANKIGCNGSPWYGKAVPVAKHQAQRSMGPLDSVLHDVHQKRRCTADA